MSENGCTAGVTEPFALRVIGDSMAPEFLDGHIIIVDPAVGLYDGAYAVIDYGGEVIFSQYRQYADRHWLEYLNLENPPIELIPPYEVKGVIVQKTTGRRKTLTHYTPPQS
jgi:SOS-response transcriptional repressor LexA